MKVLMEMGHGDEIVLADGNFPAAANAQRLIRCDGHRIVDILTAIMPYFPLERGPESPAAVMAPGAEGGRPQIWDIYREVIGRHEEGFQDFEYVERFAFYQRARSAYAIVATGDSAPRSNLLLKKGVVRP